MTMELGQKMEAGGEQEIQVQKDLRHLSSSLNGENLSAEIMFSKQRGIRSCTPPFDSHPVNGAVVRERLRRAQQPPAE